MYFILLSEEMVVGNVIQRDKQSGEYLKEATPIVHELQYQVKNAGILSVSQEQVLPSGTLLNLQRSQLESSEQVSQISIHAFIHIKIIIVIIIYILKIKNTFTVSINICEMFGQTVTSSIIFSVTWVGTGGAEIQLVYTGLTF